VAVQFEGGKALDGVELKLRRGQILGLIGPNGAGKTTLTNVLSGFQRPSQGRVLLDGREVTRTPPHRRSRLGIARTFQGVRLFQDLTVRENVEAAAALRGRSRRARSELTESLLDAMQISSRGEHLASSLPYGDERRLGIARALATRPSFLLLDEPAAGLDEDESDELLAAILRVRDDFGCGVMVIEHDMRLIMRLCEHIQVLDYGKTISEGTPAEVQADPVVRTAYLGTNGDRDAAGA
jgi:branched-chain amino acid transport system ATP-binding protein